jgi:hypothetical protein
MTDAAPQRVSLMTSIAALLTIQKRKQACRFGDLPRA